MELIEVLNQIIQKNMNASQLAELCIGTVTSAAPLEITINTAMAPLRESVLYLTDAVVAKTISASDGIVLTGTKNGAALPNSGSTLTLNSALAVGDKVLLLRVQKGQKFVILSKVYTGGV